MTMSQPKPNIFGHVFCHPYIESDYMALLWYGMVWYNYASYEYSIFLIFFILHSLN